MPCDKASLAGSEGHDGGAATFASHDGRCVESAKTNYAGETEADVGTTATGVEPDRPAAAAWNARQTVEQVELLFSEFAADDKFPIRLGGAREKASSDGGIRS